MHIQINTDRNIDSDEALSADVRGTVERVLSRFSDHITRVEVHLSDENSGKKGGDHDMRCLMEARLEGRQPVAASHQSATLGQAIDGAANKLARLIDGTLGRSRDQRGPPAPDFPDGG